MTTDARWIIKARFDAVHDDFDVVIRRGNATCTQLVFEDHKRGDVRSPTIAAHDQLQSGEFLQAMLDAAWEAGLRPAGFDDTRESMAATKAHLADMRSIAFHKVGAPKP